MPQCCLLTCKNRSESGYRLFKIPEGKGKEERIEIWKRFINRPDMPKKAYICEMHFDQNQFELHRQDGRKLLKWNAIPTVVDLKNASQQQNVLTETPNIYGIDVVMADHSYITAPASRNVNTDGSVENVDYLTRSLFDDLRQKLKIANRKIHHLNKRIKSMEVSYKELFNDDQITYIKQQTHRGETWSDETINKSLKLYLACGVKGYEEIRRQKLPYPSIRTLQQRLNNFILVDNDNNNNGDDNDVKHYKIYPL